MVMTDTLDTIWEIDNVLWELIEPLLKTFWPAKYLARLSGDAIQSMYV